MGIADQFISTIRDLIAHASASTVIVGSVSFLFWKADGLLSDSGRKLIYSHITKIANEPTDPNLLETIKIFLGRYYARDIRPGTFFLYLFGFSSVSLIILLSIYIAQTDGLFVQLISDKFARATFFQYVFVNGFFVVLIVNFVGYFYDQYRFGSSTTLALRNVSKIFLAEIALKIILFVVVTAAVYVVLALLTDSFLSSPILALEAVPATILSAITFKGLTGVYLYSVAISSFPMFVIALIDFMGSHPRAAAAICGGLYFLDFENKPIRALSALLGTFLALFGFLSFAVVASINSIV
jgi:hypothetical protein